MNPANPHKTAKEFWEQLTDIRAQLGEPDIRYQWPMSDSNVITHLSALLFLQWSDFQETEQEAIALFEEREYIPALPAPLRWNMWKDLRGEKLQHFLLNKLLPALKNAHSNPLAYRIQRVSAVMDEFFNQGPPIRDTLMNLAGIFDFQRNEHCELAGKTLESVLQSYIRRSKPAGFFTPGPAEELMVRLANPQPGERIYDPCFGTGGLLLGCAHHIKASAKQLSPKTWTELKNNSIFGIEINRNAYVIGVTRLALAGIDHPGLNLGNTLEPSVSDQHSSDKFDCILANPPWGVMQKPSFPDQFPIRAKDLETLFLQHIMLSLQQGGRAVIALPEKILYRTGPEKKVRKKLLREYRVEGVISLQSGDSPPYTSMKSNLLIFSRKEPAESVRFLTITRFGDKNKISGPEDPSQIAERFRQARPDNVQLWDTPIHKLGQREWELVARQTGEQQLERILNSIRNADADISFNKLSEVADISVGVHFKKNWISGKTSGNKNTTLIRVSDIGKDNIQKSGCFLTPEAESGIKKSQLLQPGDVLLSKSGTIGKVSVVQSDMPKSSAGSSIIIIRPRESLLPVYLAALLRSESYQTWLKGRARGTVVQNLSIRMLRYLTIPVPIISLQERIIKDYHKQPGDALSTLLYFLAYTKENPVLKWFESTQAVQDILYFDAKYARKERLVILERFAYAFKSLQELQIQIPKKLLDWIYHIGNAMNTVRDINRIPVEITRYTLLEKARSDVRLARILSDRPLPGYDRTSEDPFYFSVFDFADKLSRQLLTLIEYELEKLLRESSIEAALEPAFIETGLSGEIILRLYNKSLLPLRNFCIITHPDFGQLRETYFGEKQETSLPLVFPFQNAPGFVNIIVRWRGIRLDGTDIEGEIPLSVEVRTEQKNPVHKDLGTSPYIVGNPVDSQEMFFGRSKLINEIRRQFSTKHTANVILLEGNRRTGKTSVLKRLKADNILPEWVIVYCSFQAGEGQKSQSGLSTREVFRLMAREIGWTAYNTGVETWFPEYDPPDPLKPFKSQFATVLSKAFSKDNHFETFEIYLQVVLEAIKPRRLLLMLDEFDKLQEGIDSGITSPQVPENIRYLLHAYPDLSAILSGSRRLKRLREQYWSALFGFGHRIGIGALAPDDARLLVTKPVENRLVFIPHACDLIINLCACQPFLIQCLCNRIFEQAVTQKEMTITVNAVQKAAKQMTKDNEHFHTLWEYAGSERRRMILSLCVRLADEPDPVTYNLLETKVEEYGIFIPRNEKLGDDIDFLRELDLIELEGGTRGAIYRIAIPLMAGWMNQNTDFEDLRRKAIQEGEEKI